MKNLSLTRFALVTLFVLSSLKIFSTEPDFQANGIFYKVTSLEKRECSVCGPVNPENNPTKLIIPTEVKYNGASFTVVSVFGEPALRTKTSRYVNVKELILPNSVKVIEFSAFYNVQSLERVQMDGVKYISSNAFENCVNLKSISMKKVEFIGFGGFFECHSLEKIIIPPSCKEIKKGAFLGCVNPRFTMVIEDSDEPLLCLSTFGSGQKIYIGRNLWSEIYDSPGGTFHHVYQGDLYYFKEIEFGDKVTEMSGMNPRRRSYDDLENFPFTITIGASIKTVLDFTNDDMIIKSIYLVSLVPPLGGGFSNRTYLHSTLYVPKGSIEAYKNAPGWKNFFNIQEYENSKIIAANKAILEQKAKEEAQKAELERKEAEAKEQAERKAREAEAARLARENPVVPDGTTAISARAYKGKPIKSITIPNTVTRIGDGAFEGCTNLKSVNIPNSVTSIGSAAFSGCTGLTDVTIGNSVTSIENSAFSGCTSLTAVVIPNSVLTIGRKTFADCSSLTSVTIPNSVTSIGFAAFSGCKKLTSPIYNSHVFAYLPATYSGSYTIPDGIEQIADRAFESCRKLRSVVIPNSVTSIGEEAFSFCEDMTSIEIPNNIISIGNYAFSWCRHLTSIYIPNSVKSIGKDAFERCENLTIYLPKQWKDKLNLQDCKKVKYHK